MCDSPFYSGEKSSVYHPFVLAKKFSGSGRRVTAKTSWCLVAMFGGLHIDMAALKTQGDWLQGSGWVHATGAIRYYDARDNRLLLASSPHRPHKESSPNHCDSTVHSATPCL